MTEFFRKYIAVIRQPALYSYIYRVLYKPTSFHCKLST